MKTIALFTFLLFCLNGIGQSYDLLKWSRYPIPTNPDTLMRYNWSEREWFVFKSGQNIHATTVKRHVTDSLPFSIQPGNFKDSLYMNGKRIVKAVDDGYLISFWRGEFGGSLYWFDKHGVNKKFLGRTMIVQFIEREQRLFAISGLAHMGMSTGAILELVQTDTAWAVKPFVTLPFAPYAASLDREKDFLIITSDNLLRIGINKKIETLMPKGFWNLLCPSSAIIKEDQLFVGMRQGILHYNLKTRMSSWLMPD